MSETEPLPASSDRHSRAGVSGWVLLLGWLVVSFGVLLLAGTGVAGVVAAGVVEAGCVALLVRWSTLR